MTSRPKAKALSLINPALFVSILAFSLAAGYRAAGSEGLDTTHGVGELVTSVLGAPQFQQEYGPGWVLADGSDVSGSRFHLLTGRSKVPDLRNRVLRGAGEETPFTAGGSDSVVLTIAEMPAHTHGVSTRVGDVSSAGYAPDPTNGNPGNNWSWAGSQTTAAGGSQAFSIVPSHLTVNIFVRVN